MISRKPKLHGHRLENKYSWEEIADLFIYRYKINETGFKEWFMTKEALGVRFDGRLYRLCYNIYLALTKENRDFFLVVAGKEGSGKSTLLTNVAMMIDPNIILKQITFTFSMFINAVDEGGRGSFITADEGNLVLFSREAMSSNSKDMIKLVALMRQKNEGIGIAVPNFWTIDSYIREHRVDCLLRVRSRGFYRAYYGKAITLLSDVGKKTKWYDDVKIPATTFWDGYFNNGIPSINDISNEAYLRHKADTFSIFIKELKAKEEKGKNDNLTTRIDVNDDDDYVDSTRTVIKEIESNKNTTI